jgi:hypothetical protein
MDLSSRFLIGWKIRSVFATRVINRGIDNLSAWVLPDLAAVIPMKAKFSEGGSNFPRLLAVKLDPNPFPDNLSQFPKAWGFVLEQFQKPFNGQSAIAAALVKIKFQQFRLLFDVLCGPVQEP